MAVSSVLQLKLANPILSNSPETAASSSNYAVDITDEDFIHRSREAIADDAMPIAKQPASEIKPKFVTFNSEEEPRRDRDSDQARYQ
jgi:hypothetical protein